MKYRELSDTENVRKFPRFRSEVKIDGTNFENRDNIVSLSCSKLKAVFAGILRKAPFGRKPSQRLHHRAAF
jgi:hypothetical protein